MSSKIMAQHLYNAVYGMIKFYSLYSKWTKLEYRQPVPEYI